MRPIDLVPRCTSIRPKDDLREAVAWLVEIVGDPGGIGFVEEGRVYPTPARHALGLFNRAARHQMLNEAMHPGEALSLLVGAAFQYGAAKLGCGAMSFLRMSS